MPPAVIEEAKEFKIFISNSEIAMRTAAGEEDKLCWEGCYKFFPSDLDRKHTYTTCPFRRVREHALPYLRRFRQHNSPLNRKLSSLLAEPNWLTAAFCQPIKEGSYNQRELDDLQENWQEWGFVSQEMARSLCLMANPTTSKRTREIESGNLRSKIIRAASKNRRRRGKEKAVLRNLRTPQCTSDATASVRSNTNDDTPDKNRPFILVTLPIFSIEVENQRGGEQQRMVNVPSLLSMSQALPHIDLPIGLDKNMNLVLRAVFDSCAGLNVGRRAYHGNIRRDYPELIAQYIDLERENYDIPGVGGVDGNVCGSSVTALVTYRTPFKVSGQPIELTFGLVEGLCARLIIGITTMQKARMSYLVHAQVVTSETLNFTFQVTMQRPSTEDTPPTPIKGNSAVLHTQAGWA